MYKSLCSLAFAGLAAAATVPLSNVPGKAFDRIAIIYHENQNFDKAYGDGETVRQLYFSKLY